VANDTQAGKRIKPEWNAPRWTGGIQHKEGVLIGLSVAGIAMLARITALLLLFVASHAGAAVLVISNATDQDVTFTIDRQGAKASITLAAGESRPITMGRNLDLTYSNGTTSETLRLDAYQAFAFTHENGRTILKGIELAGPAVPLGGTPVKPPDLRKRTVTLSLSVDDANPLVESEWKARLRQRAAAATAILTAASGVTFDLVFAEQWKSDARAKTLIQLQTEFEEQHPVKADVIHIGYTSRLTRLANERIAPSIGQTLAPFHSHLVIREAAATTEREHAELLAHELGYLLGAVTAPDRRSVMRPKPADGQTAVETYRMHFDPLNVLAMQIWTEERAGGKVAIWQELSPAAQARLARIYETLAKADPTERQSDTINALVAIHFPLRAKDLPPEKPAARAAAPKNTKEEAVRRVLRGVAVRAADNAAKPAGQRLAGDDLTVQLIRTAADIALGEDEALRVPAFAVGIGLGLDDSTILRTNLLTKKLCQAVESDEEFKARIPTIKPATVHGRRDLCQHFAVSCALADLVGPELARKAGLAKELQDMKGTSGFSFADLCLDYAGVDFIDRLSQKPQLLPHVRGVFAIKTFLPSIEGLAEGLSAESFQSRYGSVSDARFKTAVAEIEKRVQATKGLGKSPEPISPPRRP
jgi:hypothetical protein